MEHHDQCAFDDRPQVGLLGRAIDAIAGAGATARTGLRYGSLIVLVTLVAGAGRFGMRELLNGFSRRVESDLRNDFLAHLLRLDATFHGSTRTGDLMSRATNDTQAVRMAVGPAIMYLANTVVTTVFALAVMLHYNVRLTLFSLGPLLLLPHPEPAEVMAEVRDRATLKRIGLPSAFMPHAGSRDYLVSRYGLSQQAICEAVRTAVAVAR